ncbi:hypothetical protein H8S77_25900 [Parabacteroides sp. BX2]|jgi:hypothetical protein|uniref:DUF5115 domain-containing protein n=1 Tax=Parabacteroides segnis TaxID=2763058 RepID=A0ABR7E942_9BACT|nr:MULTISPECIES: hypothetical protein [Parabacteroides]MBC5646305.1 hypothetical protein [Parabacteroides segnis]MCM0716262.1 hypothetical protein [Parabacteroides sp. TA-V-105]
MKKYIFNPLVIINIILGLVSCSDDSYPSDPTLTLPVSGLVLEVNGSDYVAVPQFAADSILGNQLSLSVKIPATTAIVKQIDLVDKNASANISKGDVVTFIDDKLTFEIHYGGVVEPYIVEMSYNPPPKMYLVKTRDKDKNGNKYYLNVEIAPFISSVTYDNQFEGYVDLTDTNWDNLALIQSDFSTYFDVSAGLGGGQSYGKLELVSKDAPGTGSYPSDGPWGDWTTSNNNPKIVSPGVWKINFDSSTKEVTFLETQWAISGTSANSEETMTYFPDEKLWKLTTKLSEGNLRFTTIPVSPNDPVINYGESSGLSKLSEQGTDIKIEAMGMYEITLDLGNSPFYDYTISKK